MYNILMPVASIKKKFTVCHYILVIILLLAALLRFIGTNPGYPPIHTDEGITHSQGVAMILERSLDPQHGYGVPYNYPIIVPLINAFFFLFFFIPLWSLGYLIFHWGDIYTIVLNNNFNQLPGIFDQNILGSGRINIVFWGRYVTALVGTGVVLLTFLLGKQLFRSNFIGLLGSFFVAINYRQVLNSHFGLPDIYNAFFLLLALCWIVKLWNSPTTRNFLLTGITISLYFSTKFQFFALPPLLVCLLFLVFQKRKWGRKSKRTWLKNITLMIGVMILTALILNIFHIIHWKETLEQVGYSALKYRYGRSQLDFYSLSYLYHDGIGPLMSFSILGGVILGLILRFKQTLFLLSVIIPFFWMMVYYTGGGYYTRNFVTITPILLICAAFGLWWVVVNLPKKFYLLPVLLGVGLITIVAYESLKNAVLVPIEYSKEWNYKVAQRWVGQNIPAGSKILAHPTTSFFGKSIQLVLADKPDDYFLAEMQEKKAEWAVINLEHINSEFLWWITQDLSTQLKLGWFPVSLLSHTSLAKMTFEFKDYVVFESLNPWQAPDNNFLVVKIPSPIPFENGRLIYGENFDKENNWVLVNDNFGNLNNFSWDRQTGYKNSGSLKIAQAAGGVYSQRFVSPKIAIEGGKVYKIKGLMNMTKSSQDVDKDGFLEADFLSENEDPIKVSFASRVDIFNQWVDKEIIVEAPLNAKFLQVVFQRGRFDLGDLWLDDVEVWKSVGPDELEKDNQYIKSFYNPNEHLFLRSNGGM